jgi:hypothetical protein
MVFRKSKHLLLCKAKLKLCLLLRLRLNNRQRLSTPTTLQPWPAEQAIIWPRALLTRQYR